MGYIHKIFVVSGRFKAVSGVHTQYWSPQRRFEVVLLTKYLFHLCYFAYPPRPFRDVRLYEDRLAYVRLDPRVVNRGLN